MMKQISLALVVALALLNAANAAEWVRLDNGKDLTGWKVTSNMHGTGGKWEVVDGAISASQTPPGNGGFLLTEDLTYVNYEVVMQIKPHFGNDSGLFMRSTADGKCYQVTIDYLRGGSIGPIWGELISGVSFNRPFQFTSFNTVVTYNGALFTPAQWNSTIFKSTNSGADWNTLHAGIIGNPPTIKVWLNGHLITVFKAQGECNEMLDKGNRGGIALQIHGGTGAWAAGSSNYFKNIYVKRLGPGDTIQGPGPNNDPYAPSAVVVRPVQQLRANASKETSMNAQTATQPGSATTPRSDASKETSKNLSVLAFFKGTLWPEYGRPAGKVMCEQLAAAKGFVIDITEDASVFTDANLDKYQVVIFWATSGADILNEAQKEAFKRYIEKGRGFIGMHCAIAWGTKGNIAGGSLINWPWYQELTGSTFGGCPIGFQIQPGNVIIEDTTHITTSFLNRRVWKVNHEWYAYTPNPRSLPGMKILMTLDQTPFGPKKYDEWPLVWCREFNGARSFYMTFGDAPEMNEKDLEFREFFYRSILWAAGHDTMPRKKN